MILLRKDLQHLKELGVAVHRFADEMQQLARVNPPPDWTPTSHPELVRMTAEFERATEILRTAVKAGFTTAAQYRRIARHFEAVSGAMARGAVREAAAEKRNAAAKRRGVAVAAARKPQARRR